MSSSGWEQWDTITGVLVNFAVLLGALVAVVKFRRYNQMLWI